MLLLFNQFHLISIRFSWNMMMLRLRYLPWINKLMTLESLSYDNFMVPIESLVKMFFSHSHSFLTLLPWNRENNHYWTLSPSLNSLCTWNIFFLVKLITFGSKVSWGIFFFSDSHEDSVYSELRIKFIVYLVNCLSDLFFLSSSVTINFKWLGYAKGECWSSPSLC